MATDPAIQAAARALRSARIAQYSEAVRSAPNYDRARHEPEIAEQERIGREWSWDGDLAVAAAVVAAVRPIVIRECAEAIEDHCNKYFSQDEPGDFMAAADFVRGLAGEAK